MLTTGREPYKAVYRGQIENDRFPIFATVPYRKGICIGNVFL